MEISFYHTAPGNLISAIVRLIEKIYTAGQRCVFFSPMEERVAVVDKTLWTFSTNAFIPHGDKNLGFCEKQPIYLTDQLENPNDAKVLVVADTFNYEASINFEKIVLVFEEEQYIADMLYHDLKKSEKNVNYWRQSAKGWEKFV